MKQIQYPGALIFLCILVLTQSIHMRNVHIQSKDGDRQFHEYEPLESKENELKDIVKGITKDIESFHKHFEGVRELPSIRVGDLD